MRYMYTATHEVMFKQLYLSLFFLLFFCMIPLSKIKMTNLSYTLHKKWTQLWIECTSKHEIFYGLANIMQSDL